MGIQCPGRDKKRKMLRFEDSTYLWLLLAIPLLTLIWVGGAFARHKEMKLLGDSRPLHQLMPDVSRIRPMLKFILQMGAVAVLVLIIARPQTGSKVSNEKREGIETIVCMDISNSMLAQDVAPSRLMKSKMLMENLIDNFTNDKIGLIVFAGEAYVQLPITADYVSAKMFLDNIDPSLIQAQGTDIGGAIHLAMQSFSKTENVGRAIIVITDGEDNEAQGEEWAKAAREKGINVYILGIGSTKGAPIPIDGGYLKDRQGNTVMTALNEDMCRRLAQAGSGQYIHVDNTSDAEKRLNDDLSKLQKGQTGAVTYGAYTEQFQAFGWALIFLLVIETCIMSRKNPRFKNLHLFNKRNGQRKEVTI